MSIIQERKCGIGSSVEETDSEIRVSASNSISLDTNWGGISSESNENYFSKVFLKGSTIQLSSAGTVAEEEVEQKNMKKAFMQASGPLQNKRSIVAGFFSGGQGSIR